MHINRRAFVGGSLIAPLAASRAYTQGFAGLGSGSDGFAEVVAGKKLDFRAITVRIPIIALSGGI
jgi:hypothetical protein